MSLVKSPLIARDSDIQDFSIVMLTKTLGSLAGAPVMTVLWVYGIRAGGFGLGIPYFVSAVGSLCLALILCGLTVTSDGVLSCSNRRESLTLLKYRSHPIGSRLQHAGLLIDLKRLRSEMTGLLQQACAESSLLISHYRFGSIASHFFHFCVMDISGQLDPSQ
jgi:hypothetical protein